MPSFIPQDVLIGIIVRLITSIFGTLGFAILMSVPPKKLPGAVIGGFLTCAVYEIADIFGGNHFMCAFAASVFMTLYSEIMARKLRTPAPLFFLPCAIPIVPGSGLYYSIYNLFFYDEEKLFMYGSKTLGIVVGIAVGFAVTTTLINAVTSILKYKNEKHKNGAA